MIRDIVEEREEHGMAKGADRFERVYSQGKIDSMEIWVDKVTGVNYLYHHSGYSGGLTPLLDENGKTVITPVKED